MSGNKNSNRKNRSQPQTHNKRSNKNTINKRTLMIIACEGLETEKNYFNAIFNELKSQKKLSANSLVIAKHNHTNPTGVLKDLKDHIDTKTGLTYKDYDHRWIVIDRDEERVNGGGHTPQDFNTALSRAKNKDKKLEIKVAWSNPCFELWYLLHFAFQNTEIDRDFVCKKLEEHSKQKYTKNDTEMYNKLSHLTETAIRNAKKLINEDTIPEKANPATTVYEIVELLQSLKNQ